MSYPTCISADIGTASLTLLAAITNANGTPHATVRDLACAEIGQGQYQLITSSIPYGYSGTIVFYLTALASASAWSGSTIQATTDTSSLTPLASIKSKINDSLTISGSALTFSDGTVQTVTTGGRVTT